MNPSKSLPTDDDSLSRPVYPTLTTMTPSVLDVSISLPDFWPNILPTEVDMLKSLQQNLEANYDPIAWLPQSFIDEIQTFFPSDDDINPENEGQRCPHAFSKNIKSFFSIGRVFLNYKQFVVAGQFLLDAWAISSSHSAKSLSCYYGAPLGKEKSSADLKRKVLPSPKAMCCPFRIRYSFVNKTKNVPNFFLKVRITSVDATHNHSLGIPEHRVAKVKSGTCRPDPHAWSFFVQAFCRNPQMNANAIRRMLKGAFPVYKNLSAKAVCNIRRSAYHAINDEMFDPSLLLFQCMPTGIVAANETSEADPQVMHHNFGKILAEVMRNSEFTWKALGYLKTIKSKILGFDFRVKYDQDDQPCGVMWIFPEQRSFLLRFGSVLFLDMRKAMTNNLNYPYCAITMMDQNRSPIVGAESLVCTESLENYQWLLECAAEIEPNFKLGSIKLIFGDQFLRQSLLDKLGIRETCTLRGDMYHLLTASDSVFLRNFTSNFFGAIKPFVSTMLKCKTMSGWDQNYTMAKAKLIELGALSKIDYLDSIYHHPSYYSGYVLAKIEGNCQVNGSSHAEQNHSSVAAQFADYTLMTLETNVEELCTRQGRLMTQRREEQSKWYITSYTPISLSAVQSQMELLARKVLDKNPFYELFFKKFKAVPYLKLEVVTSSEGVSYHVLPIEQTITSASSLGLIQVVDEGKRCMCTWRVAFEAQCEHELLIDKQFIPDKWHIRWYNDHHWNQTHNAQVHPNNTNTSLDDADYSNESIDEACTTHDGNNEADSPVGDIAPKFKPSNNFTYHSIMSTCKSLCNLVQHDKKRIRDTCLILETMIQRCEQNQDLIATFGSASDVLRHPSASVAGMPTPMITNTPTIRNLKRKQSALERKTRKRTPNQMTPACVVGDTVGVLGLTGIPQTEWITEHLGENPKVSSNLKGPQLRRKPTRTCGLCRRQGHKVLHCPFLERFAGNLLPIRRRYSKDVRVQLSIELSVANRFPTYEQDLSSNLSIHDNFPRRTEHDCIIIHRRLFLETETLNTDSANNYCFECTVLRGTIQGVQEIHSRKLFTLRAVTNAITSNQNSLVKCELSFSPSIHLSQLDVQSQSTMDLSQDSLNMT